MSIHVYYNPLDVACKSVVGAVKEGEQFQFNVFLLKEAHKNGWGNRIPTEALQTPNPEDCTTPSGDLVLLLNKDGQDAVAYPMQKNKHTAVIAM